MRINCNTLCARIMFVGLAVLSASTLKADISAAASDEIAADSEELEGILDLSDGAGFDRDHRHGPVRPYNPNGPVQPFNPGAYCDSLSNYPYQCDRTPGCQYSRIYSRCVEATGPYNPQPDFCSRYSQDYRSCVSYGCQFDGRTGQCYGGYNPNPQPSQEQWECRAGDRGWEEHSRGHIGTGCNQMEASRNALFECQRHHQVCEIKSCRRTY
jgi:hypothetical protein